MHILKLPNIIILFNIYYNFVMYILFLAITVKCKFLYESFKKSCLFLEIRRKSTWNLVSTYADLLGIERGKRFHSWT